MYCPNCGQGNSIEQKFCRKCGLNLEGTANSLLEQRPDGGVIFADKRLELFGNIAFGGLGLAGLAAVAALIYTVITKFILTGSGVAFGVIVSLLLIFAVLGLVYVVLNEIRKEKRAKRNRAISSKELEDRVTARLLEEGEFQAVATVVEDTTELLKARVKNRKL